MGPKKTVKLDDQDYQIHCFTGTILSSQKQIESYGRKSERYTGYIFTRRYELYLQDKAGLVKSFVLSGWNFPCKEGHVLSVLWVSRDKTDKATYFSIVNHSINNNYYAESQLISGAFYSPRFLKSQWFWGLFLICICVPNLNMLVGSLFPILLIWARFSYHRSIESAQRFLQHDVVKKIIESLDSERS